MRGTSCLPPHDLFTSSLALVLSLCLLTSPLVSAYVAPQRMGDSTVRTQYGLVRGVVASLPGDDHLPPVERYLGLQYASIGNGDLRFMPPTSPVENWDDVHLAMKLRPVCPQRLPDLEALRAKLPVGRINHLEKLVPFLLDQAEECLNLNVYVPTRAQNETERLPVVVFIHGETYEMGTGNAYDGSVMAAFGRVIVVTLNYRLGVLGFMSTGDSNAPGNYALLDQVAALHWVRENIGGFGGDPDQVTLLGQGYGGALVHLLLVSPVTRGRKLFVRAIIQSGSALSTWAVQHDPLHYTQQLAQRTNCSQFWGDSAQLVHCFKSKPYEDLLRVEVAAPKYYSAWAPVIDRRSVLPDTLAALMTDPGAAFHHVDLLLGVMKNEGFVYFTQHDVDHGLSTERMRRILRTYVRNVYEYERQKIYEILYQDYTSWEAPDDVELIRDNMMELLGDGQITAAMTELARRHSPPQPHDAALDDAPGGAQTYFYSFTYPSRLDTYPRWAGGVHGDDMTYVFGAPLTDGVEPFLSSFTRSEKMLSEAVLTFWTNFMHSGDPNTPARQGPVSRGGGRVQNRFNDLTWPTYDQHQQRYLQIGMNPTQKSHYRADKMSLWLRLLPRIHQSSSSDVDAAHHLLDHYDNASSFEKYGTRQLLASTLRVPTPIAPHTPYPPHTAPSTTSTTTTPSTTTTTTSTTTTSSPTLPSTPRHNTPPSERPATRNSATDDDDDGASDSKMSLSVTIAVGSALLFLNILVFAGVYYQKERMRQEMKQRDQDKERESCLGDNEEQVDNDIMKGSSVCPETDTNSSVNNTPCHALYEDERHTLPRSPLPVSPPLAPYTTLPVRHHHAACDHHAHLDSTHYHNQTNHSSTDHVGNHVKPSTVV